MEMEIDESTGSRKRMYEFTDEEGGSHKALQGQTVKMAKENKTQKKRPMLKNISAEAQGKEKGPQAKANVVNVAPSPSSEGIVIGTDKSIENQPKYDSFSKAPFFVIVRKVSASKEAKQMSVLEAAKILHKGNLKFLSIERYSFNTWKVTFTSKVEANVATNNKFLREMGLTAFIPKYKVSRTMVVRNIPMDFSLEEVKEAIEEENNIRILKIYRLKRREKTTGARTDSETIGMEIKGEVIPESIKILRTVNKVFPYIPAVRMCYNCGLYGHTSKFCKRTTKCLSCAEDHRGGKENPCLKEFKCVNSYLRKKESWMDSPRLSRKQLQTRISNKQRRTWAITKPRKGLSNSWK